MSERPGEGEAVARSRVSKQAGMPASFVAVTQTAQDLAILIQNYVAEYPYAAVLEEGLVAFDLRHAKCSAAETHGRCVLQLWSEERNIVRTVLSAQYRAGYLHLMTRRLGAAKPTAIEIVPNRDRRTPNAREAARRQYLRLLERVLQRKFPDARPDGFSAATDLEHSFGPAYARGRLFQGTSADAVIGVGADESASTIDGALTLGLLWLDHCREMSVKGSGGRSSTGLGRSGLGKTGVMRHFGGLKVIVPAGAWKTTAERMNWLNSGLARFELFALDSRSEGLEAIDFRDSGNVESRLVHAFDAKAALDRAKQGIDRVMNFVPNGALGEIELRARSAAEVGLLIHGLEFARVRTLSGAHSFVRSDEITFGAGANETLLTDESEPLCRQLLARLFESRQPQGKHTDALYRLQPERWLESRIRIKIEEMLPALRGEFLYTQVPAISSGDRGMLDLLTIDRSGRLAVIEVKADEDMQLPMQGLDYWIRVRALNADRRPDANRECGEFERQGYFVGTENAAEIATQDPKLLLIAPALRIHPSNEIVLRYLSPKVEWEVIAVGEHWRKDLIVVFRKRSERA